MTFNPDDLNKVQDTISAINSGDLSPDGWALDHVIAVGLSGQRNPLGSAIMHWIESESEHNAFIARFLLSTELSKKGVCKSRDSVDYAHDAMKWYKNRRCPDCKGRGNVPDPENECKPIICKTCGGTGDKDYPSDPTLRDAVSTLIESLNYLENQLRARLHGSMSKPIERTYRISQPAIGQESNRLKAISIMIDQGG